MIRSTLLISCLALGLSSCGSDGHKHDHGSDTAAADVVRWQVMRELDNLSHLGEFAVDAGDWKVARETAETLALTNGALLREGIPANVRNRAEVENLLGDLDSLGAALRKAIEADDNEALADPLRAYHAVVVRILHASGMPHVHDHDHDHDHDDCDHDHHHH